jgi:hypothetical protein
MLHGNDYLNGRHYYYDDLFSCRDHYYCDWMKS